LGSPHLKDFFPNQKKKKKKKLELKSKFSILNRKIEDDLSAVSILIVILQDFCRTFLK